MQLGADNKYRLKKRIKSAGRKFSPMSEINVTPFVDIMLVLLIIFMVAAPLLSVGVEIDLPETQAKPLAVEKEKPLTISIDKDKKIFINEFEIDRDGLRSKLLAIKKERGSNRVFLRASGKIGYENVASILALLSNSGFSQISLVTDIKID